MEYEFKNINHHKTGATGVAEKLLLAPVRFFVQDGIKSPQAPFLNIGDEVIIRDDHEFKYGCGFLEVSLAPEKNSYDAKATGDVSFQRFENDLVVYVPGSYPEEHEMIKNLIDTPLIVLIRDSNCADNMYYQIGNACSFAYITSDFGTGTTKDGSKGYAIHVKNTAGSILLYAGEILLDEIERVMLTPIQTEDGFNLLTEEGDLIIQEP